MDREALASLTAEFDYWTPEPLFAGETVFCLASGPGLTPDVIAKVRGRRSIVVNSSCLAAPSADALYFTDSSWYETHRDIVADWAGLVVSMSRTAKRELPDKVKRIRGTGDPSLPMMDFPPPGSETVWQGRTSGHTAISLAIALGAATVVMLGYDMRVIDGREHHHVDYTGPRDLGLYAADYVRCFTGWNDAARRRRVRILNATPGSAVTEFPMVSLDEVLACDPLRP